jgi:hypothetical protein
MLFPSRKSSVQKNPFTKTVMKRQLFLAVLLSVFGCARGETPPADSATAPAEPPVVTITARDFAFTMPDTIRSGMTKIVLVNEGPTIHHAQLIRLEEGKTLADLQAALKAGGPPPAWIVDMGGPNPPPTGGSTSTIQPLEPGNYAVLCFVDLPDHVPHFTKGMLKGFVVAPATNNAVAPTPTVTMTVADYSFTVDTALTAGRQLVKVVNNGPQTHEVIVIKLDSAKTVDDFMKFMQTYKGDIPAEPVGGIAAVRPGTTNYFEVNLSPGEYVLICLLPDSKDGKSHVSHGMLQKLTIN